MVAIPKACIHLKTRRKVRSSITYLPPYQHLTFMPTSQGKRKRVASKRARRAEGLPSSSEESSDEDHPANHSRASSLLHADLSPGVSQIGSPTPSSSAAEPPPLGPLSERQRFNRTHASSPGTSQARSPAPSSAVELPLLGPLSKRQRFDKRFQVNTTSDQDVLGM